MMPSGKWSSQEKAEVLAIPTQSALTSDPVNKVVDTSVERVVESNNDITDSVSAAPADAPDAPTA